VCVCAYIYIYIYTHTHTILYMYTIVHILCVNNSQTLTHLAITDMFPDTHAYLQNATLYVRVRAIYGCIAQVYFLQKNAFF